MHFHGVPDGNAKYEQVETCGGRETHLWVAFAYGALSHVPDFFGERIL